MILRKIADYLERRGEASLVDIALHVEADESAVRGMLNYWIRKGKVERLSAIGSACSGGCSKQCSSAEPELYVWKASMSAVPLPFPTLPRARS